MPDIMAQMLVTDGAADKKPTRRATLGCAGGFGAGNGDGPQRLRSLCQLPATPSRLHGYGTLGDPKRTKGATTKAIVGTARARRGRTGSSCHLRVGGFSLPIIGGLPHTSAIGSCCNGTLLALSNSAGSGGSGLWGGRLL